MTCKEIIEKHLKDNSFDGLVHLDTECGCLIEDMPICEGFGSECEPAYQHTDEWGNWIMRLYAEADH